MINTQESQPCYHQRAWWVILRRIIMLL